MDQGVIRSPKAHYRALTVQQYIHAVDNKSVVNISVLAAMNMLSNTWYKVSETTTKNRSVDISQQSQESAANHTDNLLAI